MVSIENDYEIPCYKFVRLIQKKPKRENDELNFPNFPLETELIFIFHQIPNKMKKKLTTLGPSNPKSIFESNGGHRHFTLDTNILDHTHTRTTMNLKRVYTLHNIQPSEHKKKGRKTKIVFRFFLQRTVSVDSAILSF